MGSPGDRAVMVRTDMVGPDTILQPNPARLHGVATHAERRLSWDADASPG